LDTVPRAQVLPLIDRWKDLHPLDDVYRSRAQGENVDGFLDAVIRHLPGAPPCSSGAVDGSSESDLTAELIREQLLRQTGQEVPYSAAVLTRVRRVRAKASAPRAGPRQ